MIPSAIERAFEIARAGDVANVNEIAIKLSHEGYLNTHGHLSGSLIRRQLIDAARKAGGARNATNRPIERSMGD